MWKTEQLGDSGFPASAVWFLEGTLEQMSNYNQGEQLKQSESTLN